MSDPFVTRDVVTQLIGVVQDAMVLESARRSAAGEPAVASKAHQEALALSVLRREFQRIDERRVADGMVRLSEADEDELTERVLAEAVGLGPVDLLMTDPTVEEVVASRFDLVFVLRTDGTVTLVPERMWRDEKALIAWIAHLARTAGRTERQFNAQSPDLVMRVGDGMRLAATRDVAQHVSFALRRNALSKGGGLGALVGLDMLPAVLADFFRACMASGQMRIVIVGATAAGKTTFLRALLDELGPLVRVVVVEDTAEIDLFDVGLHPNVESWEERQANNEGEGAILLGRLVKHALRYRPQWLVCGEVRDSDAAVPMLKAMTHGQASLTTVHAATALGGLDKLALYLGTGEDRLPIDVAHHQLSQAIDFVVHLDRDTRGHRYVSEVLEVAGFDNGRATTNAVYTSTGGAGAGHTMQRLTQEHARVLSATGFDLDRLGGGWR